MHSRKTGLFIALGTCVGGCVLFLIFCTLTAVFSRNSTATHSTSILSSADRRIDLLKIEGEITSSARSWSSTSYNHQAVLDTLDDLITDPASCGLILFLDTPGGSIYETDEVYLKLLQYKKAGRPIYVSMGSMATSGGYYLASAADYIVCNRNTITGSIGVIMPSYIDLSEFLAKNGIKVYTPKAGANKAMGSPYTPITDEQLEIIAGVLGEAHEQFMDVVAMGRLLDRETVAQLADGRIFSAKQALSSGLVDQIGTLEDTIMLMQADYNLQDAAVNTLKIAPPYSGSSLFFKAIKHLGISEPFRASSELEAALSLQESLSRFGYYYNGAFSH